MKQKDVILRAYLSDSERYADLWNAYLGKEMFEAQELEVMDAVGIQRGTGEPWDGTKNLKELLKQENYPEEFRDIVPDYPMNLLEIQRFEHLERFQTDLYLVFGFLQRRWDKEKLREFIEKNKERFQDLREDAYDVIQAYGKVSALKKIKEVCRTKTGGYDMCQAWNEIMEEERMKGEEMGLRLGEKKGERRGEKRGEKRGEERMGRLIEILAEQKDLETLQKAAKNRTYRKKLYKELGI